MRVNKYIIDESKQELLDETRQLLDSVRQSISKSVSQLLDLGLPPLSGPPVYINTGSCSWLGLELGKWIALGLVKGMGGE